MEQRINCPVCNGFVLLENGKISKHDYNNEVCYGSFMPPPYPLEPENKYYEWNRDEPSYQGRWNPPSDDEPESRIKKRRFPEFPNYDSDLPPSPNLPPREKAYDTVPVLDPLGPLGSYGKKLDKKRPRKRK